MHWQKEKNMLEYQEINDHFKDFALSPEQIDKILDFLEANHVDVLRITDDDDDILIDDEDVENDVEMENRSLRTGWRKYRRSGSYVLKRDR